MTVLQFHQVTRRFGDVVALNRVDLELDGGITAMVGPNGAGKSTLMRLATGHIKPTVGAVTAFGQKVWDNPDVMRRVGFVPEQDAFYEFMTGVDFVATLATLNGMGRREAEQAATEELEALGLKEGWDRPIKSYSKGMRQRVKLAQALIHRPELLFLDEPLLGCDPLARRRIQDRVRRLRNEGTTVLVSSHILPEVERLTHDVAILAGGRLVARGDARDVRSAMSDVPSRIRVHCDKPRIAAAALAKNAIVESVRIGETSVDVETSKFMKFLQQMHASPPKTWGLAGFETMDADLDSLFMYLAGDDR